MKIGFFDINHTTITKIAFSIEIAYQQISFQHTLLKQAEDSFFSYRDMSNNISK